MTQQLYFWEEYQGVRILREYRPPKPETPKPEPVVRRAEPKTVTHKIQYKDIKKVMEGISLLREQK